MNQSLLSGFLLVIGAVSLLLLYLCRFLRRFRLRLDLLVTTSHAETQIKN